MTPTPSPRTVHIVGAGLIGSSIGLALVHHGMEVSLEDRIPARAAAAAKMGAGSIAAPPSDPDLVIVSVPPTSVAKAAALALERFPSATVTDVASVKSLPLAELRALGADIERFVGGHPMAGREVSGPLAARGDLFEDRLWVLTPYDETSASSIAAVETVVTMCGSIPMVLKPQTHDHAVALTSHTPQLMSSVLAAQLALADDDDIALAGQGLRDATRVAASNAELWTDILAANAAEVAVVVGRIARELEAIARDLSEQSKSDSGELDAVRSVLERGNEGHDRLPDKHGGAALDYTTIPVVVADQPGELGRLFAAAGAAGVNLEDVRIEHTVGRMTAIIELAVRPAAAVELRRAIADGGWRVRG